MSAALTFIPYPSFFVGIAVAAWAASPLTGLALGAAYGLGRAAPALASMWYGLGVADHHLSYLQSGSGWHRILAVVAGVMACLVFLPTV